MFDRRHLTHLYSSHLTPCPASFAHFDSFNIYPSQTEATTAAYKDESSDSENHDAYLERMKAEGEVRDSEDGRHIQELCPPA